MIVGFFFLMIRRPPRSTPLSLHDALPIFVAPGAALLDIVPVADVWIVANFKETQLEHLRPGQHARITVDGYPNETLQGVVDSLDRKSTRLNSSHANISYAVFCLKKKKHML